MKPFLILCIAITFAPRAQAQQSSPVLLDMRSAATVQMQDFLWQKRLILVFSDNPCDPNFIRQMKLLESRPADLAARDVIVVVDTNPRKPSPLREQLHPRGFSLVFIDKDGQVKFRKPAPWHVREIIRSIDKTELRQQELREQRLQDGG